MHVKVMRAKNMYKHDNDTSETTRQYLFCKRFFILFFIYLFLFCFVLLILYFLVCCEILFVTINFIEKCVDVNNRLDPNLKLIYFRELSIER